MLRKTLIALGVLCLLGAAGVLVTGRGMFALPHLLAGAVVLGLGVAFERRHYKRVVPQRIEPHWQDTGERFIDPESGRRTAVYFDPRTAERHYVATDG
ncbi:MAG TPA: hypothetical protein VFK31_09430 [Rhodanobacteraceae bacterium]|nr:hypothetical protein [Rhodanobacteraceae bacterium]